MREQNIRSLIVEKECIARQVKTVHVRNEKKARIGDEKKKVRRIVKKEAVGRRDEKASRGGKNSKVKATTRLKASIIDKKTTKSDRAGLK